MRTRIAFAMAALSTALVIGAGCGGTPSYSPQSSKTQLAAYAAGTEYPRNLPQESDLTITAVVDRMSGDITLRNFTNETLRDVRLWVNEAYVLQMNAIGPNTPVVVRNEDLYDSAGNSLASQPPNSIRKLELQTDKERIQVQGPQFK